MKKIGIIGFGVVGSGVYEIIRKNKDILTKNAGEEIDVKRILDIRDFSAHEEAHLFTKDFNDLVGDSEIDIVVETMGGIKFAYEYTKALLSSGKSVVTSNKELVAAHGDEFFRIAKEKNVRYLYEASVGGGIPIIRPLANDAAANDICEVSGILNGTTNYILTKMFKENESFEGALKTAQELGYAEKDPTADVDGFDACRKISILMSLVTGKKIPSEMVHIAGIRTITAEDVTYAAAIGYTIKLIGCGFTKEGMVNASVEPMLIPESCPLSTVEDVFNSVMVKGNMVDTLMFYGRGAGKLPTASAVVGDVVDIVRSGEYNPYFSWEESDRESFIPYEDVEAKFFVRIEESQIPVAREVFGDREFIKGVNDYGFVTDEITIGKLAADIEKIGGVINKIRLYK
ncbi:MAG: homoserine dehydrogenase [Clostridia bacterium]|nr:homoserine dehydrogenase [Clostridia bacterium]